MKKLVKNIATNQTTVRRLRFKHSSVLSGDGSYIQNKQNAPNK